MTDPNTPAVPPAWLRRLVTEEGERLPVRDLTSRSRRSRPLGQLVEPATRRMLGRRGIALAPLLAHWEAIVGPALARHCVPVRLVMPRGKGQAAQGGGTLHVKAAAGAFATELVHRAPLLCERINTHLGFRAVESLKVAQGPLAGAAARRAGRAVRALPPAPPPAHAVQALETRLASVADDDLRAALDRLGRAMLRTRSPN
ncbi:DUF721 domain-containing protein [uncultured Rhodospira sp.]|uniref:DUF721 domain-containing protein n=1 Tax=uncultured Rhodospira sp. TaxID=1936189 RepID=UPI00262725C2|nr:DUF721 domain-containing protein [uncultured Rhodospira sp.]